MSPPRSKKSSRLPLYLVTGLLVLVTVAFLLAFLVTTETEIGAKAQPTFELKTDTYLEVVEKILVGADPTSGAQLVEQDGCTACHREGAVNKVAPAFAGLAERAATRRPPLTAAAYIYESITNPSAFIVEGYNPAMPQNFLQSLTGRQVGDIIAYLLTADAR